MVTSVKKQSHVKVSRATIEANANQMIPILKRLSVNVTLVGTEETVIVRSDVAQARAKMENVWHWATIHSSVNVRRASREQLVKS